VKKAPIRVKKIPIVKKTARSKFICEEEEENPH